ncbi:MAG: hypothetical protein ACTHOB_03910 [Ginsengibacter sp.]
MQNLITQARSEFNIYKNNPHFYSSKVKAISNSFGLQNPMHLRHTELPTYWAGNLFTEKEKIAVVEINRQYDQERIAFENNFRKESWENYTYFQNNIFTFYKNKSEWRFKYCESIAAALSNKSFTKRTHYDFLQETVLRLDILPYTSINFNKCPLCLASENYLFTRFKSDILPFMAENRNIKKAIFHNKRLTEILLKKNFISADDIIYIRMNKGSKHDFIYKKRYKGIDLYIFSRFIPYGGFAKSEVYSNVFG